MDFIKRAFLGIFGLFIGAFVGAFFGLGLSVIAYFIVSIFGSCGAISDSFAATGHDLVWLICPIVGVVGGLEGLANGFRTGVFHGQV